MITPISKLTDYLVLGNLGEKLVTTIQIDISEWLNEYPDGVLGLSYERPGEPRRYWPASNLSVDYSEKVLTWVVNQHALEIEGVGTLVVRLMSGDSEKRSRQIMTRVNPGHATVGPLPTPMEDYLSQLTQLAGDVLLDADRAAQAAEDAEDSVDYIVDSLGQLFKGPYDPAVVYSKPSVVFSTTGSSYAYIGASPASGMPLSDPGYWTLVAVKGASIVSAAFANDIITFTKDDGTTVQVTIAGVVAATQAANEAATLANQKAALADEKAGLANAKAGLADAAAAGANAAKVSTEVATASALVAQNANAIWTKDGRNPAEYFPAPSAPLYFRREGTFAQAGSGDPSPTNIRPITPFMANGAQIKLANSGKNLFDPKIAVNPINGYIPYKMDVMSNNADGSIRVVPDLMDAIAIGNYLTQVPGGTLSIHNGGFIPNTCKEGDVFSLSILGHTNIDLYIQFLGADGVTVLNGSVVVGKTYLTSIPAPSGSKYVTWRATLKGVVAGTPVTIYPQLELGSVATPYEPYVGCSTATLTAPEEIAAGWINNRGEGQKTHGIYVISGAENVLKELHGGANRFAVEMGIESNADSTAIDKGHCTHYINNGRPISYNNQDKTVGTYGINSSIYIRDDAYSSIEDYKAFLAAQYAAGTPVTVVYQLATPQAITPVSAPINSIPALDLAVERQNVFTSSLSGVLTYPKNKVRQDRILNNAQLWRKTAPGNPVSVYPVPESPLYTKVSGTFTQAGTGDPSPENIRPITPWLASGWIFQIKRTGKNLLRYPHYDTTKTFNGVTFTDLGDGTIRVNGTASANALYVLRLSLSPFYVKPGNYVLSGCPAGGSESTYYMDISVGSVKRDIGSGVVFTNSVENPVYGTIHIQSGTTVSNLIFKPQIELGSVATPYEPYSDQGITFPIQQEIAAGWMDNEGKGQVTHKVFTLTGNENLWVFNALINDTFAEFYTPTSVFPGVPNSSVSQFAVACDSFPISTFGPMERICSTDQIYVAVDKQRLVGWDNGLTYAQKIELLKAFLRSNNINVLCTLSSPTPITPAIAPLTAAPQLDRVTPRQNVLTASTGNVELTYAKSPIREADELAAAIALL